MHELGQQKKTFILKDKPQMQSNRTLLPLERQQILFWVTFDTYFFFSQHVLTVKRRQQNASRSLKHGLEQQGSTKTNAHNDLKSSNKVLYLLQRPIIVYACLHNFNKNLTSHPKRYCQDHHWVPLKVLKILSSCWDGGAAAQGRWKLWLAVFPVYREGPMSQPSLTSSSILTNLSSNQKISSLISLTTSLTTHLPQQTKTMSSRT